jgi:integrase/recombinase XerD
MGKRRKNLLSAATDTQETTPCQNLSFDEAVELFLVELKIRNRSKRTVQWHAENFHAVKNYLVKQNIPVSIPFSSELVKKNLILYCQEQLAIKPRTINMRLCSLKMLHAFLTAENYLTADPLKKLSFLAIPKNLIVSLNDEQIQILLRIPDRDTFTGLRDFTIMLLLLETGLRVSEVSKIRLHEINLNDGYIKVHGKGAKERNVPIQSKFKKILKKYLFHRGELDHDFLFVTVDNTPLKVRTIQERIEIIAEKSGIKNQLRTSPHIWRHSFARKYIMNGGDVFSLKTILGHNNWQMVHHYVNLFGSDVFKKHQQYSPVQNFKLPSE